MLLMALALVLAGCAAVRGGQETVTMRLAPTFAAGGAPLEGTIAVSPVLARGLAADRRYTYVEAGAPGVLRQAAGLFWEEPPPRVLERALVAGLRMRHAEVYGAGVLLPAERRVGATLTRFEEAQAGAAAEAVVSFDATVTASGRIERQGSFCARAPIAGASGTARARGFEVALAQAVGAFVQGAAGAGC